ncbi:MAG: hypothetical protein L0Z50_15845 [Verrucomicrobiales bacterium]|nr:hypothetical protein [Verrucomicrobiales bacterium]
MYRDPLLPAGLSNGKPKAAWEELGFQFGGKGTHTSRTIMLDDLSTLLRVSDPAATRTDYVKAMVDDNCLGKHTLSTRRLSLQRMTELYSLDVGVPLFRLLRQFWYADEKAHGQLALLVSISRDPLLRATCPVVLSMSVGEEIARQRFTNAIRDSVESRLNDATLDKVVRNAASSWTQSGHFSGRSRKRRQRIEPTPVSAAFALVLGYMLGQRGHSLFESLFARVLDRDENALTSLAIDAKRLGLLDIKSGGGMTVVSFDAILTEKEKRLIHGAH